MCIRSLVQGVTHRAASLHLSNRAGLKPNRMAQSKSSTKHWGFDKWLSTECTDIQRSQGFRLVRYHHCCDCLLRWTSLMDMLCIQVWSSNSVGLRIVEALITYQLYTLFGIKALTAAIIAIIWNGACILLAFLLDSHNRHVFAAVQAATGKKKRASNTNRWGQEWGQGNLEARINICQPVTISCL